MQKDESMMVYIFKCSTDSNVKLLVPTKQIPVEAVQQCKGTWNFAEQGTWKPDGRIDDLSASDMRLAIDSEKAVHDIKTKGFHIARYLITSNETISRPSK